MFKKLFSKRKLTFLMALALILSSTITSSAISLGGKWNLQGGSIWFGVDTKMDSMYIEPAKSGAASWNGITHLNFKFLEPAQHSIAYVMVENYSEDDYIDYLIGYDGYYGFGIPGPKYDSGTYSSGLVRIIRYSCDDLSAAKKRLVFVHEFGHILGLAHTATSKSSVMHNGLLYGLFRQTGPTTYDKTNLKNLYN